MARVARAVHGWDARRLREALPSFRREPFGRRRLFGHTFGENKTKDVILRTGAGPAVPVGVVSKQYQLVQHRHVLDLAASTVWAAGIDPRALKANR